MYATIQNRKKSRVFSSDKPTSISKVSMSREPLEGHQTRVDWKTSTILGDTVGVHMKAIIGPEHQQGGSPEHGVQQNIMNRLPTSPFLNAPNKYVRGHLLNDNVGGPGKDFNLFPITADANGKHERNIESHVKQWVNVDKRWVDYEVIVHKKNEQLDKGYNENYINSEFVCTATLLARNSRNELVPTGKYVNSTIHSNYNSTNNATIESGEVDLPDEMTDARSKYIPLWSKAKGEEPWVDSTIMEELATEYRFNPISTKDMIILQKGIGKATFAALEEIFMNGIYDYSHFNRSQKFAYIRLKRIGIKTIIENLRRERLYNSAFKRRNRSSSIREKKKPRKSM